MFYNVRSNMTQLDGLRLPRPREFDEGVALEAAMQRFWATGYAATSVRELGGAMGLGQASVYNAFGDKRTLFTQCLDRYLDANMRARIARVEKTLPPHQVIETFLTEIVERSLESRLGCLLANSALEVAPHDRQIAAVVAERIGELEAFFRRCVADRFAMEAKRQLDVLDRRLAESEYLAGGQYTIADIAVWLWYGGLVKPWLYEAAEFLQVQDYKNVRRWADAVGKRPAVKRGRMVNRVTGEPSSQLHERHDASDFETKTQDKLTAANWATLAVRPRR
jgi:AcrR family transcriptional regulator